MDHRRPRRHGHRMTARYLAGYLRRSAPAETRCRWSRKPAVTEPPSSDRMPRFRLQLRAREKLLAMVRVHKVGEGPESGWTGGRAGVGERTDRRKDRGTDGPLGGSEPLMERRRRRSRLTRLTSSWTQPLRGFKIKARKLKRRCSDQTRTTNMLTKGNYLIPALGF